MIENLVYLAESNFDPSSHADDGNGENCIANISPRERQKRLWFGIQQFVTTIVILVILIALGADRLWRLPLLFMFWAAAVGYFQARDKT
jgi:hypothetical protein